MNDPFLPKSPNRLPLHTDWSRYDSPAVVRKHGREYLERLWVQSLGESLDSELGRMTARYGAGLQLSENGLLLSFDRPEQALACARRLRSFQEVEAIRAHLTVQKRVEP